MNLRLVQAARAIAVFAVLLVAPCFRGLAEDVGVKIPGLPMSSFSGSGMDNLLSVLCVLVALWILKPRNSRHGMVRLMGLSAPGWRAPLVVFLCTLPFWISSAMTGTFVTRVDVRALVFTALLFPFAEELVFRGFGFVFPRVGLGWPVWAACLVQAFCFGAIHWLALHENSSDEAGLVFFMTFLGGVVFAMLDALNRYTIWCGLVFHVSLNAASDLVDAADGVWGWVGNVLRLFCALLAVVMLWLMQRKATCSTAVTADAPGVVPSMES